MIPIPEGLSERGMEAFRTVVTMANRFGMLENTDQRIFYSPAEWAARGEDHGLKSELIIVYDGEEIGKLFSFDQDARSDYAHMEAMREELATLGMYSEECTCWYSAIYEIKPLVR
jgi:hypothetical protein